MWKYDSYHSFAVFYVHYRCHRYTSVFKTTVCLKHKFLTRDTLDCDQSNYSSRIVFCHCATYVLNLVKPEIAPFDPPIPENPTVEPNMKWIGRSPKIWPFEIFPNERSVGWSVLFSSTYIDFVVSAVVEQVYSSTFKFCLLQIYHLKRFIFYSSRATFLT